MRLASGYLGQVVDLFEQLGFDDVQRLDKLLRVRFDGLLAGFLFAQLLE